MFPTITRRFAIVALGASLLAGPARAAETVIVGYFGNPTPMQAARMADTFKAATGWDLEWRKFNSGAEVIAALASGDVKLSELGSSPLTTAASQGVEVQMFMIAQVIGNAESLIARNGAGITKLEDLKGKRVAVPVGSTAHFSLMGAIKHAGLSESDVTRDQHAAGPNCRGVAAGRDRRGVHLGTGPVRIAQERQAARRRRTRSLTGAIPTFDGWVVGQGVRRQERAPRWRSSRR